MSLVRLHCRLPGRTENFNRRCERQYLREELAHLVEATVPENQILQAAGTACQMQGAQAAGIIS